MFGSEYSSEPQILLSSFGDMHGSYKKTSKKLKVNPLLSVFLSVYLRIFGIPEIGFQVRSLFFEKAVENNLKDKKLDKILDAGSGIGAYTFWMAKNFPDAVVFGGDVDQEKLDFSREYAKKRNIKNVEFGYLDITKKSKKVSVYDLIVNIDILEHVENYKVVIKNLQSQLKKNGYLYIHTPQPNQTRIFKSLKKWEHEGHVHEGYAPSDIKKTLEDSGLRVISLDQTFGFFGKLAWELNHLSFKKGFIFSGLVYPFLYVISVLDVLPNNKNGLGTAILAQKK